MSVNGSVTNAGDNRTGYDGELIIALNIVPINVAKIIFIEAVHDAPARRQSFGQESEHSLFGHQLYSTEVARYDLMEAPQHRVVCLLLHHNMV